MKEFLFSLPGIVCFLGFVLLIILSLATPKKYLINESNLRTTMQIIISGVVGIAALYIVLIDKYPAETIHWASGAIGTIVGFWLSNAAVRMKPKS